MGQGGACLRFNGSVWQTSATGVTGDLYALCPLDAVHVWVGGGFLPATMRFFNGSSWSGQIVPQGGDIQGIAAASTARAWTVSSLGGVIQAYESGTWTEVPGTFGGCLWSVSSAGEEDVWGAGDLLGGGDLLYHWQGASWDRINPGMGQHYYDIFALDDAHAWAVGSAGTVISWNGSAWSTETFPAPGPIGDMNGVFALDEGNIWVVGDQGQIWHYEDPDGWKNETLPGADPPDLYSVYATNAGDVFATGEGGTVARFQNNWTTTSITSAQLEGVTGTDESHIWACSNNGEIWSFNGTSWAQEVSGTTKALHDIQAVNGVNVWAVGDSGTIIYRDYPAPVVASITPAAGPNSGTTQVTSLAGANFRAGAIVKLRKSGQADIIASSAAVVSDAKITCNFSLTGKAAGAWDVAVTNSDGKSGTKAGAFTVTQALQDTWYLAEGSTAWGFDTRISIVNPNSTAVHCDLTFMVAGASNRFLTVNMPPTSRGTVYPLEMLGEKDFSTKVVCREGKTICADRTMAWPGPGEYGDMHSSVGVTTPDTAWYLPEGSSAWGFECWVLVQNPNPDPATVTLTYMIEGAASVSVHKEVPARSRSSFNMADDIGLKDASIKVTSDRPVIPERSMYRYDRREGHDSIGTTAPATSYYLAEGTTAWGFTTYVLVQNPGSSDNTVTITYMTSQGPVTQPSFTMPPHARKTIRVNDVLPAKDFSTRVDGSHPLIAERAMYWGSGSEQGEACHDSIGMSAPHMTFYLPDGQADSSLYETWTLVQNPNDAAVNIEIRYMSEDGKVVTKTDTIAAGSRKTCNMRDQGVEGMNAIVVRSTTTGRKIMVERAMYAQGRTGGSDTVGGFSD